jgi:hypothetical protein
MKSTLNLNNMKTLVLIAMMLLLTGQLSRAQNDSVVLNKFYHTWIIPVKGQKGKSGVLFEIKDSSVVVSSSAFKNDYYTKNYKVTNLDVRNISAIKVRRQGKGFAVLAGGVSGMIVGGFISAAYMHHLEETMDPLGFVFGGFFQGILPFLISTGIGVGVGALVSPKINIPIKGNQELFADERSRLNEYALVRNALLEKAQVKTFLPSGDSVVDIDGNLYHTLTLEGQTWMSENLKVTRYRDGSDIKGYRREGPGSEMLYDWNMVNNEHKLCPSGWHVPSFGEWTVLFNSLGGKDGAGNRMEESFSVIGSTGQWWSATALDAGHAQSLYLNTGKTGVMFTGVTKNTALSVRCIKDK